MSDLKYKLFDGYLCIFTESGNKYFCSKNGYDGEIEIEECKEEDVDTYALFELGIITEEEKKKRYAQKDAQNKEMRKQSYLRLKQEFENDPSL